MCEADELSFDEMFVAPEVTKRIRAAWQRLREDYDPNEWNMQDVLTRALYRAVVDLADTGAAVRTSPAPGRR